MADTTPIEAFNNKLNLVEAFSYGPPAIYKWLKEAAENPDQYGAKETGDDLVKKKTQLQRILQEIIWLGGQYDDIEESGRDYLAPGDPEYVYRKTNAANTPPPPPPENPWGDTTTSPLVVQSHLHTYTYTSDRVLSEPFWSPYDLLGLFLSSIGPAPHAAEKKQFFLPLTVVYGRWCAAIAPVVLIETGELYMGSPAMFQCTWRLIDEKPGPFFLGAAVGGVRIVADSPWERVFKYERFKLCGAPGPWTFDTSPKQGKVVTPLNLAQRFGNCAETYPYIMLLKDHLEVEGEDTGHGFALNNRITSLKNYNYAKLVKSYVVDPCDNCQALINWFNGTVNSFAWTGTLKKKKEKQPSSEAVKLPN